jgi:RNA polymerase sigma-70 factor (ECF subfamily)
MEPGDVLTPLMEAVRRGDAGARDRLWDLVYDEMRRLAESALRGERPDHSLQPTALVHETFLRLCASPVLTEAPNRGYLFGAAATAMRRILVDHARRRKAEKHGGGWRRTPLDDALDDYESRQVDLLALDDALTALRDLSPRQHQIVDQYHFGGFSMREIADHLGVSEATVSTEFKRAKQWLAAHIGRDPA